MISDQTVNSKNGGKCALTIDEQFDSCCMSRASTKRATIEWIVNERRGHKAGRVRGWWEPGSVGDSGAGQVRRGGTERQCKSQPLTPSNTVPLSHKPNHI